MAAKRNVALFFLSFLLLAPLVISHDDDYTGPSAADTEVLELINVYRNEADLSALSLNKGAACVAHGVSHRVQDTPCTNETGANAQIGDNEQIPDFPELLEDCDVSLDNVKAAYMATNCVPAGQPASIAAQNFTQSQAYQKYLNDSVYTSAGVGSTGVWYVLVLATNSSDGNYLTTGNTPDSSGQSLQIQACVLMALLVVSMFGITQ